MRPLNNLILASLAVCSVSQATPPGNPMPTPHSGDLVGNLTENPDIESQVKGQYPDMERKESLPLGAIQHAWDRAKSGAGVYQLTYNPNEVIRLRCREMMVTTVVFPKWERIEKITVGDEGSFKVTSAQPHVLLIQPQEFTGLDSNLVAIGASGRVYSFYLRSEGYNSKHVSDLSVYIKAPKPAGMKEVYQGKPSSQFGAQDYLEDVNFDPSHLNFNFNMAGDAEIAPDRVYSDGIRTWFDYGPNIQTKKLPVLYSVVDGVDTPVNVTREGTRLVAQAAGSFTLRNGEKVVCVYPSKDKGNA